MAPGAIPGVTAGARTDLPAPLPFNVAAHTQPELGFSRWLGAFPPWAPLLLLALWPALALAQGGYRATDAFEALFRWIPFLLKSGFLFNVVISVFAMLIGTAVGVTLGLG